MRGHPLRTFVQAIAVAATVAVSACGGSTPPTQPTPAPSPAPAPVTINYLRPTPEEVRFDGLGQTAQVSMIAGFSDGTSRDVTSEVQWELSRPLIASIDRGLVTARAVGFTTFQVEYQGRRSFVGLVSVAVPADSLVPVTGVVHDQYGRPIVSAPVRNAVTGLGAVTDASGAFALDPAYGPVVLSVERYGYETFDATFTAGGGPLRVDLTLLESPSPYVERTFEADSAPNAGGQMAVQTHRLDTRAGGRIDLLAESLGCDFRTGRGTLSVRLRSGGVTLEDPSAICGARLTGTMVDSEAVLEVSASSPVRYRVTYRVPR
jgi:hypothetical protein